MLKKAVSKANERIKTLTDEKKKKEPSLNNIKKKVTLNIVTISSMKSLSKSLNKAPAKSVKSILKKSVIVEKPIDVEIKHIDNTKPMTSKQALEQS